MNLIKKSFTKRYWENLQGSEGEAGKHRAPEFAFINQILKYAAENYEYPEIRLENSNRTALLITEPKSTFSIREIPISAGIAQVLNEIKRDGEYVVGGKAPLDPWTYQNRFKRYLRAASIKEYNFHALRHTFATNCIDNDMDVKSLSEILGHVNIQITLNKYVHPTMDAKRRQLAVLDSVYGQFGGKCE